MGAGLSFNQTPVTRLRATAIVRGGDRPTREEMVAAQFGGPVESPAVLEACRESRNWFSSSTKTATSGSTQPNARRRLNSSKRNAPKVAGGEAREDLEGDVVDLAVLEKIKSHRTLARDCRLRM